MTRRREILRAVSAAATVLAESPRGARTSFDVIGAVAARDIPLLFRPLDNLWGAFITVNHEERGIIVTTKLGLPVQRFTVAHELGHLLLGHRMSLDETIGFAGRNAPASRPAQEAAADTFASELLGPKHLLLASAKRHQWTKDKLHQPDNIGSPKTGVGGIGADSAGPRGAATAKGQLRTDPRIPLPGRACGGLLRMSGAGSGGTAGVSTRYARPPLGSGPSDDTPAVPPLREQLWALRPGLDGGVPAVDDFTPGARGVVGAWA